MDEEKEDILQLIDKILVNGHVSNLEKFYLWEHLSELITASAEAEAPSLRLAPLKRVKSFLKTNPAYYTCRRRVMEIVRTMRSFLLNLENTPRIRTVVIIKGVLEQLLWYWQLEPEQEIKYASCSLEVRLLVQQTRRRLMRCRNAVVGFGIGSIALLDVDKILADHLYLRVQSGVSPIEVILFQVVVLLFCISSLFLVLSIYYFATYILYALYVLTQFQPPTRGAGAG
jgi:hypothetical protein